MGLPAIASSLRATYDSLSLGVVTIHDNDPTPEPDAGVWVRFSIGKNNQAKQISIGGNRKGRDKGTAIAQVFGDLEIGDKAVLTIAQEIADGFTTGSAAPVIYRTASVIPMGRSGRWWSAIVEIPYHADNDFTGVAVGVAGDPAPDAVGIGEINAVVRQRWEANFGGIMVIYDNDPLVEPDIEWVRLSIRVAQTVQIQAGAPKGRYRTVGVVMAQVFNPDLRNGDKAVLQLAESIAQVYRSQTVLPVVFKTPSVTNALRGGRWWQANVTIPFHADTLHAANDVAVAPTIVSPVPQDGVEDFFYQHLFKAGGTTPITWSVVSGALPPGLGLDATTGSLAGTPATDGTFNFTVRATNVHGFDEQVISLEITETADTPVEFPDAPCLKGTGTPIGNVTGKFCQHYVQSDAENLLWRCISDPSGTDWILD